MRHGDRRSRAFVRDLWRQKDLGVIGDKLTAHIGPHGAELYRIGPVKTPSGATER